MDGGDEEEEEGEEEDEDVGEEANETADQQQTGTRRIRESASTNSLSSRAHASFLFDSLRPATVDEEWPGGGRQSVQVWRVAMAGAGPGVDLARAVHQEQVRRCAHHQRVRHHRRSLSARVSQQRDPFPLPLPFWFGAFAME